MTGSPALVANPADSSRPEEPLCVRVIVVATALYWIAFFAMELLDNGMKRFFARLAIAGVLALFFAGWWLFNRRFSLNQRLAVLGWSILLGAIATVLRDPSFVPRFILVFFQYTVPTLVTLWTLWLWATRRSTVSLQRFGMFALPVVVWAGATAMRLEGLTGEGNADIRPRWVPSAEQQFLAERTRVDNKPAKEGDLQAAAAPLVAGPHDWTDFRGPQRDGAVHGVKIATNWTESPPKLAWRRRVGPGWSSIVVVGNRLFTQEQRGAKEAVVCFDTITGEIIWAHEDKTRFSETMGGDGPRATPTFADGKIYALGATGILNCLDAATGKLHWSQRVGKPVGPEAEKDAAAAAAAKPPAAPADAEKKPEAGMPAMYWGYTSSPLVTGGKVIVFVGGDREGSLVALHADSGEPAWKANSGTHSYSSPQLATFGGKEQVLFLSDVEFTSVDSSTGKTLWQFPSPKPTEGFPALQPAIVSPTEALICFNGEVGTMLLSIAPDGEGWKVEPKWPKKGDVKPNFSDFVQYQDAMYGFEPPLFCCADVQTGKRQWKKGRYGAGQVLLLADQGVLLVISEAGEAVLVAADPKKSRELGRFQAITGKTWNHPTVVDGRLYVRNAEEMACYELQPAEGTTPENPQ